RDDLLAKMRRRGARTDAQADRRPIERGRVAGWEARTRAVTKLLPFAVEQKEGGQQARVDLLGKAAYRVERRGERTPGSDDLQQPLLSREQDVGLLARGDVLEDEVSSVAVAAQLNPLPRDVSVKPRAVLASPDDFPLHRLACKQFGILGQDP